MIFMAHILLLTSCEAALTTNQPPLAEETVARLKSSAENNAAHAQVLGEGSAATRLAWKGVSISAAAGRRRPLTTRKAPELDEARKGKV